MVLAQAGAPPPSNGTRVPGDVAAALTGVGPLTGPGDFRFRLVDVVYSDSFGDGWNGAALSISKVDGETVYQGTLHTGHGKLEEALLPGGCYDVAVTKGAFGAEASWAVCDGVAARADVKARLGAAAAERRVDAAG